MPRGRGFARRELRRQPFLPEPLTFGSLRLARQAIARLAVVVDLAASKSAEIAFCHRNATRYLITEILDDTTMAKDCLVLFGGGLVETVKRPLTPSQIIARGVRNLLGSNQPSVLFGARAAITVPCLSTRRPLTIVRAVGLSRPALSPAQPPAPTRLFDRDPAKIGDLCLDFGRISKYRCPSERQALAALVLPTAL